MPIFEGSDKSPTGRLAIVASRFNHEVVDRLLTGAKEALAGRGVDSSAIDVAWVPGAFELPLIAQYLAKTGKYVAVVCLGAVIRGDTDHYDYVCDAATTGILQAGLSTGIPVLFGVLTCDTDEQAWDRAGGKAGNKGADVALAALEMADLLRRLRGN